MSGLFTRESGNRYILVVNFFFTFKFLACHVSYLFDFIVFSFVFLCFSGDSGAVLRRLRRILNEEALRNSRMPHDRHKQSNVHMWRRKACILARCMELKRNRFHNRNKHASSQIRAK